MIKTITGGDKMEENNYEGSSLLRKRSVPEKTQVNLIGLYLIAFLLVLMIVPILLYMSNYNGGGYFSTTFTFLVYIGCAGGLGGTTYCMKSYSYFKVYKGFELVWTSWYIFRPFISIIMGVFVYFFIEAGLMGAGADKGGDILKGMKFYLSIAFLAGFFMNEFISKLQEIAKILFKSKKEEETEKT